MGLKKPVTAAESTVGIFSVLGVTHPGVFEWFLYREPLAPVVWAYQVDVAAELTLNLHVQGVAKLMLQCAKGTAHTQPKISRKQ